jgi:hypothetical protein
MSDVDVEEQNHNLISTSVFWVPTVFDHFQLPRVEVGYFCRVYELMKKSQKYRICRLHTRYPIANPHNIRDLRLTRLRTLHILNVNGG